jgi:hypothetical protein
MDLKRISTTETIKCVAFLILTAGKNLGRDRRSFQRALQPVDTALPIQRGGFQMEVDTKIEDPTRNPHPLAKGVQIKPLVTKTESEKL